MAGELKKMKFDIFWNSKYNMKTNENETIFSFIVPLSRGTCENICFALGNAILFN